MKSPRLLPVVIFATLALLVFKGVGIVTQGGYVLSGARPAHAAEGSGDASGPSVENAAPRTEPTMSDTSPTLTDTSPTLAVPSAADNQGEPAPAGHAAIAADAPAAHGPAPTTASAASAPATPPATPAPSGPADALAMQLDQNGKPEQLTPDSDSPTAGDQVLQRLSQRRTELDKREADLNMREAIMKAAERQMTERSDALKALQTQISSVTRQKQASQGDPMVGIVKLYENMKPQDAAAIFDGLDMNVLLHVVRAMDPRKMSPILAKMSAQKAQELTTQLAAGDLLPPPTVSSVAVADPNALPQIVGH